MNNPIKTAALNVYRFFYLLGEALYDLVTHAYYYGIQRHFINRTPKVLLSDKAIQNGYTYEIIEFTVQDDEGVQRSIENIGWQVENHLPTAYFVVIKKNDDKHKKIVVIHSKRPYCGTTIITGDDTCLIKGSAHVAATINFNE